jgi:tetratricopeptide (TPR) repeat protein
MAFGWFSKKKSGRDKALEKARKLAEQNRWAEALTYYEEAADGADPEEAVRGVRTCRERLVDHNLEEARAYAAAGEPQKAREHAGLALEIAATEEDLVQRARTAVEELGDESLPPAPERLFAPTCAAGGPPASGSELEEATAGEHPDPGDLFEFYLESLSIPEKEVLESLGDAFRRGFVLLQQGETGPARPLLEAAANEAPDSPGVPYALGLLASLEGDAAGAEARFARALELSPRFGPAAQHRADVLREAGRIAEAASFLEGWLQEDPEDGEAWMVLAACRVDAGASEDALAAAETARALLPKEDPRAALLKARILRMRGDTGGATEALQEVATRRPDLLEALIPLGQVLIETGGAAAERAAEVFKRCYRLDPERGWWYLVRVAEAYLVRGWTEQAREVLATAGQQLPASPEARAEWEAVSQRIEG